MENPIENSNMISIAAIFTATARFFPEDVERFGRWLHAAALARSRLDPLYDFENKKGLFALEQNLFADLAHQIGIENASIHCPLANSLVAAKFFRWAFDKFEKIVHDETERLLCAFLSLDAGYFATKAAINSVAPPTIVERVAIILDISIGEKHKENLSIIINIRKSFLDISI